MADSYNLVVKELPIGCQGTQPQCRRDLNPQLVSLSMHSIASTSSAANNESSEVCGVIKPGRRVKLNSSQAVNVHKLLSIRYSPFAAAVQWFI